MAYVPICPICRGTIDLDETTGDDYVITERAVQDAEDSAVGVVTDLINSEYAHVLCYQEDREAKAKKVSQA